MDKTIKIVFITLIVNGLLLPFYGLTEIDLQSFVAVMVIGMLVMCTPTVLICLAYFLTNHLSGNWLQKGFWRIALSVFLLICIALLYQIAWSIAFHDDSLNHFTGFWGHYSLWTLLTCLLIPLLDRFFSKRNKNRSAASDN